MKTAPGILVAEVTWQEVMDHLEQGAAAVLPIGAAAKEHGLHLPMNTDYLQAQWLSRQITKQIDVVVWPILGYGHYPAFVDYPGSCSLSTDSFITIVSEIINDIFRAGAKRALLLNTGISTIKPLQQSITTSVYNNLSLINVYEGEHYKKISAGIETQKHGSHADELETSIMLAIAPDKVAMGKAQACVDHAFEKVPFNRDNPKVPNYTPSGVYGDPTLATKEKGEQLLSVMLEDVIAAIRENV